MPGQKLPTKYDEVIRAIIHTLHHLGVTEEEVKPDVPYVVKMYHAVASHAFDEDRQAVTEILDAALVGLLHHRHMPYYDASGSLLFPETGDDDYSETLIRVIQGLMQEGVPFPEIDRTMDTAGPQVVAHISDKADETEGVNLITLVCIGALIQAHAPMTNDAPRKVDANANE